MIQEAIVGLTIMYAKLKFIYIIHYNTIISIIPILYSITLFLGINLTMSTPLEINNIDLMNPSFSTAGSSNITDLPGDDKPWIDLKLVKYKGNFYAVDSTQSDGANLIKQLQPEAGQAKPDLVNIKTGAASRGLKLDLDVSTKLSSISFEGKKYEGNYVDLKFPNASLTSLKIPIQKNESGSIFIISKKA